MDIALRASELLWVGALAAVPIALAVGGVCSLLKCRPATRHALWCAVLASFITPVLAGIIWRPGWFASGRVLAAADSISARVAESLKEDPTSASPDEPAPSPNRARPAASVAAAPEKADPNAARVVGYVMSRALPALLARAREPIADGNWPARLADATREYSRALNLLSSPRSVDRSAPTVETPDQRAWREPPAAADDRPFARTEKTIAAPSIAAPVRSAVELPDDSVAPAVMAAPAPAPRRVASAVPHRPAAMTTPPPAPVVDRTPMTASTELAGQPARTTGSSDEARAAAWPKLFRDWLAAVLAVRDSIAAVPPMPAAVWAGGAGLIASLWLLRLARARRLLARGTEAPADVRAMVSEAARRLGLSRPPEVMVIDERVSPMIWCGLRPRLVLPTGLWEELDADSRLSVVLHELAHLRRRDHRLCWLECLIGLVYWWHPAAWWARRRVRDEADLACDAWVLSVVPGHRRAYAEALVTTKSYLSVPGCRVTPGLGVMTGRTRKLSRRLTMVMTQRVAPRPSLIGAALAVTVAMTGMFVTPGLACPPEEEGTARVKVYVPSKADNAAKEKAAKEKAAKAKAALKAPSARGMGGGQGGHGGGYGGGQGRAAAPAAPGPDFYGEAPALEAMRARAQAEKAADSSEEAQLRRLEEQLRALEQRLENLNSRAGQGAPARPSRTRALTVPGFAVPPAAPAAPSPSAAPAAPSPFSAPTPPAPPAAMAPLTGPLPSLAPLATMAQGQQIARSYSLPEGKLGALIGLMSRDDVPVLIEPHSDHIVVHASPAQHEVFGAFVRLIHPDAKGAQALTTRAYESAAADQVRRSAELSARSGQLHALRGHIQGLAGQRSALEARAQEMERKADEVRRHADELRERAEQLREKSDRRRSDSGEEAPEALAESEMLLTQAAQLEAQAESVEHSALDLESHAQALEAEAEALEEAADDFESSFEDISEQIEEAALAVYSIDEASECDEACTASEENCGECSDACGEHEAHEDGDEDVAAQQSRITDRPAEAPEAEEPAKAGGH